MRGRDNIAFWIFMISVAAMDSKDMFLPMICCICSLFYLFRRARENGMDA